MKALCYIVILFFLFSCDKIRGDEKQNVSSPTHLTGNEIANRAELVLAPQEYVKWVSDPKNGLVYSKTIDAIRFSILSKPIDYIVCMELKKNEITTGEYESIKSQLGDMEYFTLKIKVEGFNQEFLKYNLSSGSEYEDRVTYSAFKMQDDIKLMDGSDTIPCSLFHFERAFDVVPYGEFILGFEKSAHPSPEKTFILYDKLFHKGTVKFTFDAANLTYLPKLSTL